MAPEVEKADFETTYSAFSADIFSFGCVIYFLCTGIENWENKALRIVSEN